MGGLKIRMDVEIIHKSNQILERESISKLLLKYSIPTIIAMMVNGIYNVIDRILIGNIPDIGALATIGVGIAMPIMSIIVAFGVLVGSGAAATIAIDLGASNKEKAEKTLGNAMALSVLMGLIITLVGIILMDQILVLFGASSASLPYARDYMSIVVLGTTFSMLSTSFNHLIRGDGNPKLSAQYMIMGFIVNGICDVFLIFVLDMGIKGAALGTVISQVFTAGLGLRYYLGGKSNLKLYGMHLRLSKEIVAPIIAVGASPFLMQITASGIHAITNNMLKSYGGDLAIGAMTTISTILMVVGMPVGGDKSRISTNHWL